jgi:hypothetical protein
MTKVKQGMTKPGRRCVVLLAAACGACGGKTASEGGPAPAAILDASVSAIDAGGPEQLESGVRDVAVPPDGGLLPLDATSLLDECTSIGWGGVEPKPYAVELLVDVSSSMLSVAPNSSDSEWTVTLSALAEALGLWPPSAWVGIQFFPNQPTGTFTTPQPTHTACVNQSANLAIAQLGEPGSVQRLAVNSALASPILTAGAGTPTLDAYRLALAPFDANNLPIDRSVVLITDGQPNYAEWCVGNGTPAANPTELTDPIVAAIADACAGGIRTFVIGLPSSGVEEFDQRPWLSRAARAGGTALPDCSDIGPAYCHMDLTATTNLAQDLGDALGTIGIPAIQVSCTYPVFPPEGTGLDLGLVNMVYTAGDQTQYVIVENDSAVCDFGWHYIDGQFQICGATCDQIQSDPAAQINFILGCPSMRWP